LVVAGSHREVERAFSPGEGSALPDLTELDTVQAVERVGEVELDATYYDTPGLVLLRTGVTLRRRTGGDDEGWHLKLPVGTPGAREEVHAPLGDAPDTPPADLVELVSGWTGRVAVAPVARLQTTRTTWRVLGPKGQVLAELADDRVVGWPAQLEAEPVRWREFEVELVDAETSLLDEVERLFATAGVLRSEVQRKVVHVLGEPDPGPPPEPTKKGPARLLLDAWLRDQVREIEVHDPIARRGGDGGVHGIRQACRRLRAALATYRPLLDRDRTDPLREELRWLARSLGQPRDDEVVLARIGSALEDEEGPDAAAARRRLERYAVARAAEDQAGVTVVLGSDHYLELRRSLADLVADPPWTAKADAPARDVLPRRVRKEWKRLRRRRKSGDPHELRKAAKRVRYAYELLEPAWGKRAARPRKAARELTRVLGDRQDGVAAREWLVALAAEATRDGEPSFSFGRLHAHEEEREPELLAEAEEAWKALKKVRW
jgi:CHAD domain-containing protein